MGAPGDGVMRVKAAEPRNARVPYAAARTGLYSCVRTVESQGVGAAATSRASRLLINAYGGSHVLGLVHTAHGRYSATSTRPRPTKTASVGYPRASSLQGGVFMTSQTAHAGASLPPGGDHDAPNVCDRVRAHCASARQRTTSRSVIGPGSPRHRRGAPSSLDCFVSRTDYAHPQRSPLVKACGRPLPNIDPTCTRFAGGLMATRVVGDVAGGVLLMVTPRSPHGRFWGPRWSIHQLPFSSARPPAEVP
jgi:hypothetical protein